MATSQSSDELRETVIASPRVATHWHSLGASYYAEGQYKESIAAYERAMQLGDSAMHDAALAIARGFAKLGNGRQAVRWLERAQELGQSSGDGTSDAPELARLRANPAVRQRLDRLRLSKAPRSSTPLVRTLE